MDRQALVNGVERDAIVIDALHRALYTMALTSGSAIAQCGVTGTLHFEYEIAVLRHALFVLGIDTSQPLPPPSDRK